MQLRLSAGLAANALHKAGNLAFEEQAADKVPQLQNPLLWGFLYSISIVRNLTHG